MKILIYGLNFSPELTGVGKYTGEMVEYFSSQGHECRVLTSVPYYPEWKVHSSHANAYGVETWNGAEVVRCPLWVPENLNGWKRMVHLLTFLLSSCPALLRYIFWSPDLVLCVAPTMFCSPLVIGAAKVFGAKSWLHIQDLEVDAMLNLWFGGRKFFLSSWIKGVERFILRRFDGCSTISSNMMRLVEKDRRKNDIVYFPNWIDSTRLGYRIGEVDYRAEFKISDDEFLVLYSGNFGKKQNLDLLLDVAGELKNRKDIKFVLVGDGTLKNHLLRRQKLESLTQVQIFPLQPYEQLGAMLRSANLHLVLQSRDVADLVMPSKWTTILAVGGHSLVTADPETEMGMIMEEFKGIATRVEPDSMESLKLAIEEGYRRWRSGQCPEINEVAMDYARVHLQKSLVLDDFLKRIQV